MKNCVSIVLGKEEITLKIHENTNDRDLKECLEEKIPELKKLYQDEKTPIFVTGKSLKNRQMDMIRSMIEEVIDVKITFDSPKVLGLHGIKRAFLEEIQSSETKFFRGSLRSGRKIEYEGSIVVLGDVNAGAEVIAGENIVVLGSLRGLAHAGAKGNKAAMIAAMDIDAPQLRIANVVKEMEKSEEEMTKRTYAYLKENEMIVE